MPATWIDCVVVERRVFVTLIAVARVIGAHHVRLHNSHRRNQKVRGSVERVGIS